jgi:hypothetical protein
MVGWLFVLHLRVNFTTILLPKWWWQGLAGSMVLLRFLRPAIAPYDLTLARGFSERFLWRLFVGRILLLL